MPSIPERFIANEHKVELIKSLVCGHCELTRRTNLKQLETPGQELGADIWSSKDIFGLSINVLLCTEHDESLYQEIQDVNITPIDIQDEVFISDDQLSKFDFDKIECHQSHSLILKMIKEEIETIKGTFPITTPVKGSQPEIKKHDFKLKVYFIAMVLNVFHFEVKVLTNETGEWKIVERETRKNYFRSVATKIRKRLLDERKVYPVY